MSALLDLYLPLCDRAPDRASVLGHLGQSIDGYIATANGDSSFVNDQENIRHLHRLRALHDAVIVGAGTVAIDNPRLTTRRVAGPNPVRVVLDPRRRLSPDLRVFRDGASPTLLVTAEASGGPSSHGQADVVFVPCADGSFDLGQVVEQLASRGLKRLFVEGGGTTVSRFYEAGLLDRLQITIAPVLTGRGKPGLRLPAKLSMSECPRPPHRVFGLGQDILFDCVLPSRRGGDESPGTDVSQRGHTAQVTGGQPAARPPTGAQATAEQADDGWPSIRRIR
jgi:riboflavin-specific deaminase-like protein